MKLLVAAFMIGSLAASVQNHAKQTPQAPVETFAHKYFAQLDKTNAALKVYTNTPCTVKEFIPAAENFSNEAKYLQGMYKNIPATEDEIVEAHEIEAYIGFIELANQSIDDQNECLKGDPPQEKGSK